MPNLLALSFEGALAPAFDLVCLRPGEAPPDGWGLGYYPGAEPSACVLKEPAPRTGSIRSELVRAWEHVEASTFLLHVRKATWGGRSDANTQPISRSYGGRDFLLAHAGSLHERPSPPDDPRFLPVGSTDSELIFCRLLALFAARGWRTLDDVPPDGLQYELSALATGGSVNVVLTDGRDLCAFADPAGEGTLHILEIAPPYEALSLRDHDLDLDLTRRGAKSRRGVVVASAPLQVSGPRESDWMALRPGELVVVRQGAVRAKVSADGGLHRPGRARAPRAEPKRLHVVHRTLYRYERTVERSAHVLRLVPAHDRTQTLLGFRVHVSVDGQFHDFDDVFGNRVRHLELEAPYSQLLIESEAHVETLDVSPLEHRGPRARARLPLVWMPWQHHMLQPYLLPPELPESELQELGEYAMAFTLRSGGDLIDTLLDLCASIHRDYAYVPGSTNLHTTPFDVYANRRGVCQDFTNLFICLARLLGVPARYTCGYLYTGPKGERRPMAEASHAWAQVYLPERGWVGFDPTNGCVTTTDHVRVAVGRNWRDATPTSGTIFVGGGRETLEASVEVERE